MANISYDTYMKQFDNKAKHYITPKNQWNPVDKVIFSIKEPYNVPLDEAEKMRVECIGWAFKHHYENNQVYHDFAKQHGVKPDDIKTQKDLFKIPILPDGFFKQYPDGKDFASWIGNIYTGDLPEVRIKNKHPTYDQVIDDFRRSGILVTFSSGTSGRHTFIPRSERTFKTSEYSLAVGLISMIYPWYDSESHGFLLMPNPAKTNIYAGRALQVYVDAVKTMQYAIDRPITTGLIRTTMGAGSGVKAKLIRRASQKSGIKMVNNIISWLEHHEKTGEKVSLIGAPFILYNVMKKLEANGQKFNFGEQGAVATGGGWKVHEKDRLPVQEFRSMVQRVLGIPEKFVLDTYGMVESNGWFVQCPEGHYLHAPYTYFQTVLLDDDNQPIDGYGEYGRLAFLDGAAYSYPGFITTGDKVRMLERCPVCDRPGPVLEPEIKRVKGAEMRGCAEEMRTMMAKDLTK